MIANYGYQDASGEYYIIIDTDKCNGCGECANVCPKSIIEMITDDYDELVPMVKEELSHRIGYICEASDCVYKCQKVCTEDAITHSW